MDLCHVISNKPLFSCLTLYTIYILEGLGRSNFQSFFVSDDNPTDNLNHLLIESWQITTLLSNQPLLTCMPFYTINIC